MKITIDIKDSKAAFFLELLQNFEAFITIEKAEEVLSGKVKIKDAPTEVTEQALLSDEEKKVIDQRLAKAEKHNFQKGYTLNQVNQHLTDKYAI